MRVRVIGVGSGFGDDAAGLAVADRLAGCERPALVTVARCERPLPDLLDALDGVDAIVLVDATRGGGPAGTVRRLQAGEIAGAAPASSHGFGVARALALARALGSAVARVEWIGIEVGGVRPGDPLSREVEAALPGAAAAALALACEIADLEPWSGCDA